MADETARRVLRLRRQNAGAVAVSDSDHKPWNEVRKDLFCDDLPRKRRGLVAWLDEVQLDRAVARPQHAGRDLDDRGEDCRIADCTFTFLALDHPNTDIHATPACVRQWQDI